MFDENDRLLCLTHIKDKPSTCSEEFVTLASIIMSEENIQIPSAPQEALLLYFTLQEIIKNRNSVG